MTITTAGPAPGLAGAGGQNLFRLAQALEDAIVFRRARSMALCSECASLPGEARCDDHATDLTLIAGYERDARVVGAAIRQQTVRRRGARGPARGRTP